MKDKLKQFIDNNREAFDAETPSPQVWETLKKRTASGKVRLLHKPMLWAASFTGIVLLSATLFLLFSKNNTNSIMPGEAAETSEVTDFMNPVYTRQISKYKEVIGLQQNELKLLEKDQPNLYKQFMGDIQRLDSAYVVLKSQLPDNPNREMLLEAMISNLQLQSDLLSRHLNIIKEIKQKKYSHEKQVI